MCVAMLEWWRLGAGLKNSRAHEIRKPENYEHHSFLAMIVTLQLQAALRDALPSYLPLEVKSARAGTND
jgi:hypothetical protein